MASKSDKDVNIAFVGEDLVKPATDAAGRDVDKLQKKVDSFSTKKAAAEQQKFASLIQSSSKDGETAYAGVQRAIDVTKAKVEALRKDFAKSGSFSVFGDLSAAKGDLSKLEGFLSDMGGAATKAGTDSGSKFSSGFASVLASPGGLAAVAGAAALVSAVAGAAIETGLTTALGFGFIGAGALVLKGNKQLASDFGELKADIGAELSDAASPLVQPFEDALGKIDKLMASEKPTIGSIFDSVAPAVGVIEGDLEGLVRRLLPMFALIGQEFTAILDDPRIQSDIHLVEDRFVQLFSTIIQNKQTVKDTFEAILVGIVAVEVALKTLMDFANGVDHIWHAITGPIEWAVSKVVGSTGTLSTVTHTATAATNDQAAAMLAATRVIDEQGNAIDTSTMSWSQLATAIGTAAETEDTFAGAVADKMFSVLMNNDEATLHWYESLTNLSAALKTNHNALSLHTAAGQADREAILGVVQANIQSYDANIASGMSAKDAAAAYDKQFDSLLHIKGLTKDQQAAVDGMVASYKKVPDQVNTDIVLGNLDKTLQNLETLLAKINNINMTPIDIGVNTGALSKLNHALDLLGNGQHAGMEAGLNWQPTMPDMSPGGGMSHAPRQPAEMSATVTSNLVLDGNVIHRQVARARLTERHAQRVGKRR